jgi:hypothetical protein
MVAAVSVEQEGEAAKVGAWLVDALGAGAHEALAMLPKEALDNVRGDIGSRQWTNLVNRQVHSPQGDDQPGQTDLIPSVAPVARVVIDHGRGEQPAGRWASLSDDPAGPPAVGPGGCCCI